jgi:hypothetical protein
VQANGVEVQVHIHTLVDEVLDHLCSRVAHTCQPSRKGSETRNALVFSKDQCYSPTMYCIRAKVALTQSLAVACRSSGLAIE